MNGIQFLDELVKMGVATTDTNIEKEGDIIYWLSAYKGLFHEGEGQYLSKNLLAFLNCDEVIFYLREENDSEDGDQIGFYYQKIVEEVKG